MLVRELAGSGLAQGAACAAALGQVSRASPEPRERTGENLETGPELRACRLWQACTGHLGFRK